MITAVPHTYNTYSDYVSVKYGVVLRRVQITHVFVLTKTTSLL